MTDHIHTALVINFYINLERTCKTVLFILPVGESSRFIGRILYRFVHFACTATLCVRCGSVSSQVTFGYRLPTILIPQGRLRLKNLIFSLSNIPCYLYYLKVCCRVREIPPFFYLQAALRRLRLHVTSLPCVLLARSPLFLLTILLYYYFAKMKPTNYAPSSTLLLFFHLIRFPKSLLITTF